MTALVTGASAGLGLEFAKLFARDRIDLLLVARRKDRLEQLAAELSKDCKVQVLAADLGTREGVRSVIDACAQIEIDYLVNNAGFGTAGAFAELPCARELEELDLNVRALTELSRALLPAMIARKRGRILNIGSTAGFQPGPFMAVYYASKAYVNSFTEALSYELRGTGVTATVSCPGATATEFAQVAGNHKSKLFALGTATAAQVAGEAYRAMMKGKRMVVHGAKNKAVWQLQRLSPRATVLALAAKLNR